MFVLGSDWPRYFRRLLQNYCLWGQQTCSSRVPQEVLFLRVIHMPHMEFTDPVYISSHMEITYPIYIIPYGNYWPRIYRIRSLTHCVTNNTCTVLGHGRISHSRMSSLNFTFDLKVKQLCPEQNFYLEVMCLFSSYVQCIYVLEQCRVSLFLLAVLIVLLVYIDIFRNFIFDIF